MPPTRGESVAFRALAALLGIVALEAIRYLVFRREYTADPSLWFIIGGAMAFNILPPAARIVANALVLLGQALAPLIAPL